MEHPQTALPEGLTLQAVSDRGTDSAPWFAINARPRYEKMVAAMLAYKGCSAYLPLYRKRRKWSDRVVEIDYPLFPGYLFCRFHATQRRPVITTPGVVSVLGASGQPEPIPEHEITAIQNMLRSGFPVEPHPHLREGERITISKGPLRGVDGFLVKTKSHLKVVVSVTILHRSVAVELDQEALQGYEVTTNQPLQPQRSRK